MGGWKVRKFIHKASDTMERLDDMRWFMVEGSTLAEEEFF